MFFQLCSDRAKAPVQRSAVNAERQKKRCVCLFVLVRRAHILVARQASAMEHVLTAQRTKLSYSSFWSVALGLVLFFFFKSYSENSFILQHFGLQTQTYKLNAKQYLT